MATPPVDDLLQAADRIDPHDHEVAEWLRTQARKKERSDLRRVASATMEELWPGLNRTAYGKNLIEKNVNEAYPLI